MIIDQKIRLTQAADEKGFTLLHHAALKQKPGILKFLLEHALNNQREDEDIFAEWLNSKTSKEKFTPLHFASFKGDLKSS